MMSPLISPEDLRGQLHGLRLLDARPGPKVYAAGHLPGALHADLDRDLSTASWEGFDPSRGGRHPLPPSGRFARQLGDWGIAPETDVVVYDDQSGAKAAARLWWMMRALGHTRVQVLDGGLLAAAQAGLAPDTRAPEVESLTAYPDRGWTLPTVDIDVVEELTKSKRWKVLDVRSGERYRGEVEPLDPVAGHIPGALNLCFTENLGPDGRFKSKGELRLLYDQLRGDTAPDHIAVHCGSGVAACHTLLALDVAGLTGSALYVGSWSEWCRSGRPQAKGAQS
jgi:thiosulfate/3-mercaptopyruvate sulfurtransferase